MTVDFGLNLLGHDEFRDLRLDLFHRDVKGLGNLSQIDDLVGRDVLNQGLLADLLHEFRELGPEKQVILHLRGNEGDLPLVVHVASI